MGGFSRQPAHGKGHPCPSPTAQPRCMCPLPRVHKPGCDPQSHCPVKAQPSPRIWSWREELGGHCSPCSSPCCPPPNPPQAANPGAGGGLFFSESNWSLEPAQSPEVLGPGNAADLDVAAAEAAQGGGGWVLFLVGWHQGCFPPPQQAAELP